MKNWKTTTGGIGMLLTGLGYFVAVISGQVTFTIEAATVALASVSGGFGLLFAKDNNVTGGTVQQ